MFSHILSVLANSFEQERALAVDVASNPLP